MNIGVPTSYRAFRAMVVLAVVAGCAVLIGAAILAGTWEQAFQWGKQLVLEMRDAWKG